MSNNTTTSESATIESEIVAYYAMFLMITGTLCNLLTLIILCRSSFQNAKKQPAIHYMRAIAIFDIWMLYGWNLNHYLSTVYGFTLTRLSIPTCKLSLFIGYFTTQSSAWLRVLSFKNVISIIISTVGLLALFNLHLMVFACFYTPNGTININSKLYQIFPLWDYINLGVYNGLPFILMVIFNSGVIYHLIRLRQTSTVQNSRIQHRSISITLVITTFLFLIMTLPSSIAFGFFSTVTSAIILNSLDAVLFTYHITSFPLYFITFTEFRRECIAMIKCTKNTARVAPTNITANQTQCAPPMIK